MLSFRSESSKSVSERRQFGVRRQAKRDAALDGCPARGQSAAPKRRRRFALPAHSKLAPFLILIFTLGTLVTGCRRDMQDQPKSIAYRENTFYKDGTGSRPLVEGTVPRGYLREDRALYLGKKPLGQAQTAGQPASNPQNPSGPATTTGTTTSAPNSASPSSLYPDDVETFPFAISREDLQRGQERYDIFCSACHGKTGAGDGMVARRGFNKPAPASYHQDRLRQAPVGHFFDAMTNGWGAMPSFASQVPVEDRWRIIAYIRALQLSQMPPGGNPSVREGANQGTAK